MELKGIFYELLLCPTRVYFMNPFNGIERLCRPSSGYNLLGQIAWIHSMELKATVRALHGFRSAGGGNPFNGIERAFFASSVAVVESTRESIQWNWKSTVAAPEPPSPHACSESIQWNWKRQLYNRLRFYEKATGNPFNGIESCAHPSIYSGVRPRFRIHSMELKAA